MLLVKNPRADLLQSPRTRSSTELTGIKVSAEQVPEQQQRQKVVIEFTSGKPTFDVGGALAARAEAHGRQGQVVRAT